MKLKNITNEITTWNQTRELDSYQKYKYLGSPTWSFLKLTREELHQIDQKTRKLMAMHKVLYPRDDTVK